MKNRQKVTAPTDTTKELILSMAANLSSKAASTTVQAVTTLGQALTSGGYAVYDYLTTPAPFPEKPRSSRLKTTYDANVTASIALPDRPKQKAEACKPAPMTYPKPGMFAVVVDTTQAIASYLPNPFSSAHTAPAAVSPKAKPKAKKKQPKVLSPDNVDAQMIALVSDYNALPDPTGKDYEKAEQILLAQLKLVEQEIVEHAQRRVDLYFYLLVAVYEMNGRVEKKWTSKQHGIGNKKEHGTNACHDSLFPHVKLRFTKTTTSVLWSLITTQPSIRNTHFEDANNMTVELPECVNVFDTYLEVVNPGFQSAPSKYVNKLLNLLNLASQGKLRPVDGMNDFLKIMKDFFDDFENKHLQDKKTFEFPTVMAKIWELQKVGTLRAQAFETETIDKMYICSLLRIPYHQTYKYIDNPDALLARGKDIQKEIYATPSSIPSTKQSKSA